MTVLHVKNGVHFYNNRSFKGKQMTIATRIAPVFILSLTACSDVENDHDHHGHDHEAISKVILDLVSQADGSEQTINYTDPQSKNGGADANIVLASGTTYDLSITMQNDEEKPVEDITIEIIDESDEHQVFFTGSVIDDGAVTFTYEDEDSNGLPLGVDTTFTGVAVGSGDLTITLQHMAEQDGNRVKREGMADDVAAEGLAGIAGEGASDFSITFDLDVE